MPLLIDKKILFYFFILILFGSINNKNFLNSNFFNLKNFEIFGLSEREYLDTISKLKELKNTNILFLNKNDIKNILSSNDRIETFVVLKKYPSEVNIRIKKTSFLANIIIDNENFLIGSNKKFIKSDIIIDNLPMVQGKPKVKNFLQIKYIIDKSFFNYSDIKNLYFFKSGRWDLKLNNDILIKLPKKNTLNMLNECFNILKLEKFKKIKTFDLRINNQIILDEF